MKEKPRESIWQNTYMTVGMVCIAVIFAVGAVKMALKSHKTSQIERNTEQEVSELILRKQDLEEKIEVLSTDRGVEEELRNQYRVVHPGEQQIVIIENEPESVDEGNKGLFSQFFNNTEN